MCFDTPNNILQLGESWKNHQKSPFFGLYGPYPYCPFEKVGGSPQNTQNGRKFRKSPALICAYVFLYPSDGNDQYMKNIQLFTNFSKINTVVPRKRHVPRKRPIWVILSKMAKKTIPPKITKNQNFQTPRKIVFNVIHEIGFRIMMCFQVF